jgi:hypothetical protein
MNVKGGKNIIQHDNFRTRIDGPSKCNPSFLSTAQGKALFADFSLITRIEQLEICLEGTLIENFLVTLFVEGRVEDDVVLCKSV